MHKIFLFRHRDTKFFRRKNVIHPSMHKIFRYPKLSKTLKGRQRNYWHCETKIYRRKNVIPPIMHEIFRYPKFSETLKGCPQIFSALSDQKFSTEKRDTPPPFFSSIKPLETRNFLRNSRVPLRNFSALWDIKISTENSDMPLLSINFFR